MKREHRDMEMCGRSEYTYQKMVGVNMNSKILLVHILNKRLYLDPLESRVGGCWVGDALMRF